MTSDILNSLSKHDDHIFNLIRWIKQLEDLSNDIASTDRDRELESALDAITRRLVNEVGVRVTEIIFCDPPSDNVIPFPTES